MPSLRKLKPLLGLIVISACVEAAESSTPLPAEVEFTVDQVVAIEGTDYTLQFRSVSEDSRCPVDVVCVWAGRTVLQFTLRSPSEEAVVLEGNAAKTVRDIKLQVLSVTPTPRSNIRIDPRGYKARVRIERGGE